MKRFIITLFVVGASIGFINAQTAQITPDNPAGVSVYPEVWFFDNHNNPDGGVEKGHVVKYLINKRDQLIDLEKYNFTVTLWREKDPFNPVYTDGNVTDWNKLEQIEFALSPRERGDDSYIITRPDHAQYLQYERTKEAKREATWTSAFKYYIKEDLFANYAYYLPAHTNDLNVTFFVRYDMEYEGKQYDPSKGSHVKGKVSNAQTWVTRIIYTQKGVPIAVYSELTQVKGKERMDSGLTEDGFNMDFKFQSHPKDCPFDVTLSFWREKDPLNPLYEDGKIEDFKMMDMMQFTQSTKDPSVIGATWHNEEDYEMVSEYTVHKTKWEAFSIYLPEVLFRNFDPPYMPDGVERMPVRYYIMYQLSSDAGFVSNENRPLPWVEWVYAKPYKQDIKHVGDDDLSSLFDDDDETPEPPSDDTINKESEETKGTNGTEGTDGNKGPGGNEGTDGNKGPEGNEGSGGNKGPGGNEGPEGNGEKCIHEYYIKHNPSLYFVEIPQPEEPEEPEEPKGSNRELPPHQHYDYLKYNPTCDIQLQNRAVAFQDLPEDFSFEAKGSESKFIHNFDDLYITESAATEGLWAAMFPGPEVSRGYSTNDKTPMCHMCTQEANELVRRMNKYAEHYSLPWVFTIATVKEAKHADLNYIDTGNEDDDAFTADSCFYIAAQSTLPAKVGISTRYRITTSYTAVCQFPECTYVESDSLRHHTYWFPENANRECDRHYAQYERRNKETEANLEKLKKWLAEGKVSGHQPSQEPQPRYVWFVEDIPYKLCSKCKICEKMEEKRKIVRFFDKKEAEDYYLKLKK